MNKPELLAAVAKVAKITKPQAEAAIDAFIGTIGLEILDAGKSRIDGLGTFEVVKRGARTGRNPQTGEPIQIPERQALNFRPAADLKKAAAAAKRAA